MTDALLKKSAERFPNVCFLQNEPMKHHTTFRIGGPAELMAIPQDREALIELLAFLKENDVPYIVIGNGSNLLVSDLGIGGVVVKTEEALPMISLDGTSVTAGAGVTLSRLSSFCRDHSLTGLEFAHGIPGTLGGAVYMNAGAYGGEMSQVVASTEYLRGGTVYTLSGEEHAFSYRHSYFSGCSDCVILSALLSLRHGVKEEIVEKIAELSEKRRLKQPLNLPSAGSVFKRPDGHFAGKLIQDSGLCGFTIGGAQVSEKHAGFIVNRGNASCSDVLSLIDHIKTTVFNNYSVTLECEIKFVGKIC